MPVRWRPLVRRCRRRRTPSGDTAGAREWAALGRGAGAGPPPGGGRGGGGEDRRAGGPPPVDQQRVGVAILGEQPDPADVTRIVGIEIEPAETQAVLDRIHLGELL